MAKQKRLQITIGNDDKARKDAIESHFDMPLCTILIQPIKELIMKEHDKLPESKKAKI